MTIGDLVRLFPRTFSRYGSLAFVAVLILLSVLVTLLSLRSYCADRSRVRIYDPLSTSRGYVLLSLPNEVQLVDPQGGVVHLWVIDGIADSAALRQNGNLVVETPTSTDELDWQGALKSKIRKQNTLRGHSAVLASTTQLLPNKNTLSVQLETGRVMEKLSDGRIVWMYESVPDERGRFPLSSAHKYFPEGTQWANYLSIGGSLFGGMCR